MLGRLSVWPNKTSYFAHSPYTHPERKRKRERMWEEGKREKREGGRIEIIKVVKSINIHKKKKEK